MTRSAEFVLPIENRLGHQLHAYQRDAVAALLEGRDVLAVVPTGGGKTAVAQAVTLCRREAGLGVTVAVEPIIALIDDQFRRAEEMGLRAARWNCHVSESEKATVIEEIQSGELDLLLTTPESIANPKLHRLISGFVGLAWIDEAHICVSSKHFREFWARVGTVVERLKPQMVYACTATCSPPAQAEIIQRCRLKEPYMVRISPDRPNLEYRKINHAISPVMELCHQHRHERVLIYVTTRKNSEWLHRQLFIAGHKVAYYHGGMAKARRQEAQARFCERKVNLVVATDAFALGVDFPDIRCLICYDPADSISAWVQQAGRAGRDGKPALVAVASGAGSEQGWDTRRFLIECTFPPVEYLGKVWNYLLAFPNGMAESQPVIAKRAGIREKYMAGSVFHVLKRHGLVEVLDIPKAKRTSPHQRNAYRARGDFSRVDFKEFYSGKPDAYAALLDLRKFWDYPADKYRTRIVDFFGGADGFTHESPMAGALSPSEWATAGPEPEGEVPDWADPGLEDETDAEE